MRLPPELVETIWAYAKERDRIDDFGAEMRSVRRLKELIDVAKDYRRTEMLGFIKRTGIAPLSSRSSKLALLEHILIELRRNAA